MLPEGFEDEVVEVIKSRYPGGILYELGDSMQAFLKVGPGFP